MKPQNETRSAVGNWKYYLTGALFILVLWCPADIVTMGISLNTLTPWGPYLGVGTAVWALILIFIYWIFIHPIIMFCRMKNVSFDIRYKAALQDLKPYYDHEQKGHPKFDLYHKMMLTGLGHDDKVQLLKEYSEIGDVPQTARRMISNYSKATGTLVALSRNKFVDSFLMLVMQVKLVIDITRLYGYKSSPVFNVCCFVWVCMNSLLAIFMQDIATQVGDFVENKVDDLLDDLIPGLTGEVVSSNLEGTAMQEGTAGVLKNLGKAVGSIPFIGGAIEAAVGSIGAVTGLLTSLAFEAAVGGSIVYATGYAFLLSLEGTPLIENKLLLLIKLRREGRRKIFVSLLKQATPEASEDIDKMDKEIHEEKEVQ